MWDYLAHSLGWSALSFILGVVGTEAGWWTLTRERRKHRDNT
jgi:hypothetical protein